MKTECQVSVVMSEEIAPEPGRTRTEIVTVTVGGSCDAILTLIRDLSVNPDLVRTLLRDLKNNLKIRGVVIQ